MALLNSDEDTGVKILTLLMNGGILEFALDTAEADRILRVWFSYHEKQLDSTAVLLEVDSVTEEKTYVLLSFIQALSVKSLKVEDLNASEFFSDI